MESSQIAICLLTNEDNHLEEWLNYHRKYKFNHFILFCDGFIPENLGENVTINIVNSTKSHRFQMEIYEMCCKNFQEFEYLLVVDSDEYYESKTGNIQEDIKLMKKNMEILMV